MVRIRIARWQAPIKPLHVPEPARRAAPFYIKPFSFARMRRITEGDGANPAPEQRSLTG